MPESPQPTHQDIENARRRQAIADRFRAEYAQVEAFAVSLFGPGWEPTGVHHLIAHDEADRCRRSGEKPKSAASVFTAERNGQRRHFMVTDGHAREVASYETGFGLMLTEPDTERTIEVKGQQVHPHRYGLYWAGFEPDYRPRSAESLAAARGKREEKAEATALAEIEEAASGSLFPDWVREVGKEEMETRKKGRKR